MNLRFRFTEYKFSFLWIALQDAGFTYNAARGEYYYNAAARDGSNKDNTMAFDGAKDLCTYLDRFAVKPVHSNLQDASSDDLALSDQDVQVGRDIRSKAVRAVYQLSTMSSSSAC